MRNFTCKIAQRKQELNQLWCIGGCTQKAGKTYLCLHKCDDVWNSHAEELEEDLVICDYKIGDVLESVMNDEGPDSHLVVVAHYVDTCGRMIVELEDSFDKVSYPVFADELDLIYKITSRSENRLKNGYKTDEEMLVLQSAQDFTPHSWGELMAQTTTQVEALVKAQFGCGISVDVRQESVGSDHWNIKISLKLNKQDPLYAPKPE